MKAIFLIEFCVPLLLTIIPDDVRTNETTDHLDKMAKTGGTIDEIFEFMENGSLGCGSYGSIYKGQLLVRDNMNVAMKFSPFNTKQMAQIEYEMYQRLNAIDNPDVVAYGIPSIYYYGTWEKYTMMAMTLLDPAFQKRIEAGEMDELEIWTVFREFVRIIKYIHSRGVIHLDTKIENIIIQNGQGYIIDFGISAQMNQNNRRIKISQAKNDFRKFLNSVFKYVRMKSVWHWFGLSDEDAFGMTNISSFVAKLKTNEGNSLTGLKRVLVEFKKHAFDYESAGIREADGTWIPFYDQLYRVIIQEMENCGIDAISSYSSLSHIPDPFEMNK